MTAIKPKLSRDPNQRAKPIVVIVAAISGDEHPEDVGLAHRQRPARDAG